MEKNGIDLNSKEFHDAERKSNFHARAFLMGQILPNLMRQTADYLMDSSSDGAIRFRRAWEFMEYDLEDAFSASVDSLRRCGFFPYAELSYEFDAFQTLLLQGRYKQTRDSMRRMLDVCVTSVMYLLELKGCQEAREWISSKCPTPQYGRTLKLLKSNPLINELDEKLGFTEQLQKQYWYLCDYCHTRGIEFSTGIRKGSQANISGVDMTLFCEDECQKVMAEFADVVALLSVLFVAHNPGLLVPVDKDAKWGLNQPVSGFFYEGQVKRLYDVLPEGYASFFHHYAESSDAIAVLRDYLAGLPDLSEEDLEKQAKMWKEVRNDKE